MTEADRDSRNGGKAVLVALIIAGGIALYSCCFGGRNIGERYLDIHTTHVKKIGERTVLDYVDRSGQKRQVELTQDNLEKMTR